MARVAVAGTFSRDMRISDMVYPRTILGPPRRNIFYEDAADAVHLHDFLGIVFADDLNAHKAFDFTDANETLYVDMRNCKQGVHK